jgi:hypothetical protein
MNYLEALKIYNQGKNSWCSPRRGTPEYYMVRSIMNKNRSKSLNSTKSSVMSTRTSPKNTAILAYKKSSSSSLSSSSVKLPKKRILPIKKAKRLYDDSSSSSVKLHKKRILPIKKAKRLYDDSSSSSVKLPKKRILPIKKAK